MRSSFASRIDSVEFMRTDAVLVGGSVFIRMKSWVRFPSFAPSLGSVWRQVIGVQAYGSGQYSHPSPFISSSSSVQGFIPLTDRTRVQIPYSIPSCSGACTRHVTNREGKHFGRGRLRTCLEAGNGHPKNSSPWTEPLGISSISNGSGCIMPASTRG